MQRMLTLLLSAGLLAGCASTGGSAIEDDFVSTRYGWCDEQVERSAVQSAPRIDGARPPERAARGPALATPCRERIDDAGNVQLGELLELPLPAPSVPVPALPLPRD